MCFTFIVPERWVTVRADNRLHKSLKGIAGQCDVHRGHWSHTHIELYAGSRITRESPKPLTSCWPWDCTSKRSKLRQSCKLPSVQFSCSVMSNSLWPHEPQNARPPCPSPTPRVHANPCPLSRWCHPISHPLSSPSPPALNLSQHQDLFKWVSSSHQVAKVLEFQLQHQSFQGIFRTDLL